jgi:hypothetical protein
VSRVFGISRKRQKVRPPSDAKALEDVVVQDLQGGDIRLGDLWSRHPALLVFLRHYG